MLIQSMIDYKREAIGICNVSNLQSYVYVKSTFDEVHRKWKNVHNATPSSGRYLVPILKEHSSKVPPTLPVFTSETISVVTIKYWMEGSWKFFQSLYDLHTLIVSGLLGQFVMACILFVTVNYDFLSLLKI